MVAGVHKCAVVVGCVAALGMVPAADASLTAAPATLAGLSTAALMASELVGYAMAEEQVDSDDISVEDGEAEGQQGAEETVQVDPEQMAKLQELFKQVSSECQAELDQAYSNGGAEISDACKAEVQQVMKAAAMAQGKAEGEAALPPKDDPTGTILMFVFTLFAAMIGWGVYAQMVIVPTLPQPEKKKLSKQKQLKEKLKQQREQQAM
mmetsp:Transcript_10540/g.18648  ORF Transcript_10540/g.18648 Transcript_10540/m.18648 type:complete len:208 (-) Transcript_10540:263-886(-)